MGLPYHPKPGQYLYCDFTDLRYGEIDKKRFVIVISPKDRGGGDLCTVVPTSTTPPPHIRHHHYILEKDPYPKNSGDKVWVKCDLVMTVSFSRLSDWWDGKEGGKRNYMKLFVSDNDLNCVRKCVLHSLGMGGLTKHL